MEKGEDYEFVGFSVARCRQRRHCLSRQALRSVPPSRITNNNVVRGFDGNFDTGNDEATGETGDGKMV